jgi:hypothetical protein
VNPLKVWSVGGRQADVQLGGTINVDLAKLPQLPSTNFSGHGKGQATVNLTDCGPYVRLILSKLDVPVCANGELPAKFECHIKATQMALAGLLDFETCSAGTRLHQNNSYLVINEHGIALFSCPDGIERPVFSLSLDQ